MFTLTPDVKRPEKFVHSSKFHDCQSTLKIAQEKFEVCPPQDIEL